MPDPLDHIHQAVREGRFDDARAMVDDPGQHGGLTLRHDDIDRLHAGIAHAQRMAEAAAGLIDESPDENAARRKGALTNG